MQVNYGTHKTLILDLMRHGEPEGGVKYRGHLDDPLSNQGWQQMRHNLLQAQQLGWHWDHIISSPLQRCNAFAKEAAAQLGLNMTTVNDLKELGFGDLEGMTPQAAWEQHSELLSQLWQDPAAHCPPNGEPFNDFSVRVKTALDNLIAEHHQGGRLLLVVHGGIVRAALHNLIKIPAAASFRCQVPYASFSRFVIYLQDNGQYEADLTFLNNQFPDLTVGTDD